MSGPVSTAPESRRVRTRAAVGFGLVHLAAAGVFFLGFSWKGVVLCLASYYFRMFSVTAGFHRYFSHRTYRLFGAIVTIHQVVTVAILATLMVVLTLVLLRTRVGIYIRAIADDPDAGRWVGIPLNLVGTGVYAFAGGLSAFAGVLLASTVGISVLMVLVVFLRALTMSVLGGFTSLPLALGGCLLLGIGETTLMADLFGPMGPGTREIVIMTALFALVFLINRLRRVRLLEIAGL